MKRLFILFMLFLFMFMLSSCYSYRDIQEKEDQWYEKYSEIENEYYSAAGRVHDLEYNLSKIYDNYLVAHSYYEGISKRYTEDEAFSALENIGDILHNLGY